MWLDVERNMWCDLTLNANTVDVTWIWTQHWWCDWTLNTTLSDLFWHSTETLLMWLGVERNTSDVTWRWIQHWWCVLTLNATLVMWFNVERNTCDVFWHWTQHWWCDLTLNTTLVMCFDIECKHCCCDKVEFNTDYVTWRWTQHWWCVLMLNATLVMCFDVEQNTGVAIWRYIGSDKIPAMRNLCCPFFGSIGSRTFDAAPAPTLWLNNYCRFKSFPKRTFENLTCVKFHIFYFPNFNLFTACNEANDEWKFKTFLLHLELIAWPEFGSGIFRFQEPELSTTLYYCYIYIIIYSVYYTV